MNIDDSRLIVPIPDTQHKLGGIGKTKLYDLVNSGDLTKVNIGRRGFITRKSIEAYVDRIAGIA